MTPVNFKGSNFQFIKPPDMTDAQCGTLHVCRTRNTDRFPILVSCWRPTWRERLRLLLGCPVWLTVVGTSQPPVMVTTNFGEACE